MQDQEYFCKIICELSHDSPAAGSGADASPYLCTSTKRSTKFTKQAKKSNKNITKVKVTGTPAADAPPFLPSAAMYNFPGPTFASCYQLSSTWTRLRETLPVGFEK